jgi:hypothetical protein
MSAFDVPPDEMGTDPEATDDALDRVLFGGAPVDDEWRDVALFVQELQEAVPSSGLASQDVHVAAMVETARLLADKGDLAVRPVSNAAAPAPQASGLPKQRRKPMRKKMAARILAPIAAAFVVFGGMAYAGALPWSGHDPASVSTISPSDDDAQDALGEDDQGEDSQVDEGDQGEDADDQGDNDDQGESSDDQGDQGESADDQGESSDEPTSDDQGENDDDQGDNDDQDEDEQGDETSGSDQGDDSQSGDEQDSGGNEQGDSQD